MKKRMKEKIIKTVNYNQSIDEERLKKKKERRKTEKEFDEISSFLEEFFK